MITIINVSEKAKDILRYAGWSENRRISIQDYINHLSSAGYKLNDEIRNFLRSFGNLSLKIEKGNISKYFILIR